MPSAKLIGLSTLLAPDGWIRAGVLKGTVTLVGVDRHGIPISRKVRAGQRETAARVTFVGTAAAFGAFSSESRLISSNGTVFSTAEIAEGGRIRETSFETHTELPEAAGRADPLVTLWPTLVDNAAAVGESSIALRRRDIEWPPAVKSSFLVEETFGSHRYCIVKKGMFVSCFSRDWVSTLLALGRLWLFAAEDERLELERAAYPFGLWYISALKAKGMHYRLRYDSLQHSSYMFIQEASTPIPPIERGACAFFAPGAASATELEWEDRSWSPISSGFLIAPG